MGVVTSICKKDDRDIPKDEYISTKSPFENIDDKNEKKGKSGNLLQEKEEKETNKKDDYSLYDNNKNNDYSLYNKSQDESIVQIKFSNVISKIN